MADIADQILQEYGVRKQPPLPGPGRGGSPPVKQPPNTAPGRGGSLPVKLATEEKDKQAKEKAAKTKSPESFLHQTARSAVESLPTAGMAVGGALGTLGDVVAGPMGTIAGAGLGVVWAMP